MALTLRTFGSPRGQANALRDLLSAFFGFPVALELRSYETLAEVRQMLGQSRVRWQVT